MNKNELLKRYALFVVSLFFAALGVAFTKSGALGVSPISSVPNILNIKFPVLSMGSWLFLWNALLLLGQILILRKMFQPVQLLQLPLSLLFGLFTDFGMWCVSFIPTDYYPVRLFMVFIGVIVLGFGVSLSVIANVIMNSGEAFVKVLSDTLHKNFGNVKICFDVSCVLLSILLSLLFFEFTVVGTREGTLIAAFGTGLVVKWFCRRLSKPLNKLLSEKETL